MPTIEPACDTVTDCATVSSISTNSDIPKVIKSQKTVNRYLEDLYDNGLVYRKQGTAPGSPWTYWVDDKIRQKAMSEKSIAVLGQKDLGHFEVNSKCPKYMAKYKSDSLIESIKRSFVVWTDKNDGENVKA